jgi:hypothetical protein
MGPRPRAEGRVLAMVAISWAKIDRYFAATLGLDQIAWSKGRPTCQSSTCLQQFSESFFATLGFSFLAGRRTDRAFSVNRWY